MQAVVVFTKQRIGSHVLYLRGDSRMVAVLCVGIFSIRGDALFFSAAHFSRCRSGKLSNAKKRTSRRKFLVLER